MVDLPFVDFHCHFPSPNAIYCTAKPEAWAEAVAETRLEAVAATATQTKAESQHPLLCCQGLLPQYWTFQRQEELLTNLQNSNIQLGEVGLDKRFSNLLSLQEQEQSLLAMLQFAKNHNKIVTIHSVQATERTINILKDVKFQPWKVLWHGFTGSLETAKVLFKMGVFVSVGIRYTGDLKELALAHPRFVLETDYEGGDQTEYNALLEAHYERCAQNLGWATSQLKEHCYGQAQTFTN